MDTETGTEARDTVAIQMLSCNADVIHRHRYRCNTDTDVIQIQTSVVGTDQATGYTEQWYGHRTGYRPVTDTDTDTVTVHNTQYTMDRIQ